MNSIKNKIPFITSGLVIVAGLITLSVWVTNQSSWQIQETLKILSPLGLELTFLLLLIASGMTLIALYRGGLYKDIWGGVGRNGWICLGVTVVVGVVLLAFVVPRDNRIYYDEQIYMNIGQTIAHTKGKGSHSGEDYQKSFSTTWKRFIGQAGMCNEGRNEYGVYDCFRLEYNKEPNGWAYILSVAYRIFGVGERVSRITTNVMYLLSIITVFLAAYLLFNSTAASAYAAVIFALTPEVLLWSNTMAVEPSAAFFPALAILCALVFLRTKMFSALFLTTLMTVFASQFRPESAMICSVIVLLFVFRGLDEFKHGRMYLMLALFFVLMIPHFAHIYAVKDQAWGGTGPKFSFEYFSENFKVNFLFYLRNMRFPLLFTLFTIGAFCLKSAPNQFYHWKEKLTILLWFLLFWGIFVFFYAGSYNYGADVRFSLLSAAPLALLGGLGASQIVAYLKQKCAPSLLHCVLGIVIVVTTLSFMPMLRAITQEAWAARADVFYAKQMVDELPPDSIVLTHNPNMFLVWGQNAAQASLVTEQRGYFNSFFNRYKGGVYFHFNFWCNVDDPLQKSFCQNILKRFKCVEIVSYQEKNYRYALYKVERKRRHRRTRE